MTATVKTYLLAALGLLTLTLTAFAIVWPLNAARYDDWVFYYAGLPGVWSSTTVYALRPYALNGVLLANILFPGQAQGIYVVHVIGFLIAAFSLFHTIRLLNPGYTWFAFLVSAVYLFYVPLNSTQLIPLQFEVYSWSAAVMVVAFALYVHSVSTRRWLSTALLIAAGIASYVAVLSYESTFPVLFAAPFVVWLLRRKLSWHFIWTSLAFWGITFAGFVQFVIPYLHGDPSTAYQNNFFKPVHSVQAILNNTSLFYGQSFPLETIYKGLLALPASPYLVTALVFALVAVLAVVIFWRRFPAEHDLPTPRTLILLIVIGLVLNGLGGAAYIYANLVAPRGHYFSAPAQALVVVSVFGLVAWALRRFSIAPFKVSLFAFVMVFFALSAHWYRTHQEVVQHDSPDFSQHSALFKEILALIPDTVTGTLIIYDCPRTDDAVYTLRAADSYGIRYLYRDRANIRSVDTVGLENDVIRDGDSYANLIGPLPPRQYGYDQLVVLTCSDNGLRILDTLPAEWKINTSAYDPYKRIVSGFIQPWQAQILAR